MSNELYNEKGREILSLNRGFRNLDVIWVHPETGAKVFVGNQVAAKDSLLLKEKNIQRVVNCTKDIPLYHSSLSYFRFQITSFYRMRDMDQPGRAQAFFKDVFAFIDEAMARGESVLIHCLAGAHRAGSTGIAWIMYKHQWGFEQSFEHIKTLRPIIRPLGMKELLLLLGKYTDSNKLQ